MFDFRWGGQTADGDHPGHADHGRMQPVIPMIVLIQGKVVPVDRRSAAPAPVSNSEYAPVIRTLSPEFGWATRCLQRVPNSEEIEIDRYPFQNDERGQPTHVMGSIHQPTAPR